jgi:hypothetical protein
MHWSIHVRMTVSRANETDRSYLISQLDKIQAQLTHGCAWHRFRWSVRKLYGMSATHWLTSGLRGTQIEWQRPWHTSCCTAKPRHLETRCGIRMWWRVNFQPCIQDGKAAIPPGRVYARHGLFLSFLSLSLLQHDPLSMTTSPSRQGLCMQFSCY